jgi:hypothetical protein
MLMTQLRKKYSKSKLEYNNLDSLPFQVVRTNNDNFYNIVSENKIRRNLSWQTEKIVQQSTIFDLGDLCLLSRIHILDANVMRINLEVSPDLNSPFVKVAQDMDIVSGKIRILKVGSLPCRYFRIKVTKGCNIQDYKKIECFGLQINDIKNKYDEDTLDILFYNSYDLIYRKENLENTQK